MGGTVKALIYIVACTPDMLSCGQLHTEHIQFEPHDVGACHAMMEMIVEDQQRLLPGRIIMGRCQIKLADPPRKALVG